MSEIWFYWRKSDLYGESDEQIWYVRTETTEKYEPKPKILLLTRF